MEETKPINGKALYTPKGAALEYGRIGCNFYTGCPHDCEYCYLKRGAPSKQLGGTEVRLKKCFKDEQDAIEVLRKELDEHLEQCQRYGIFLSFTTDPMIRQTRKLTMRAITEAVWRDVPVWVLTKDASFIFDHETLAFLENTQNKEIVHFGFTLTGHDEMEPAASTNRGRIMAMKVVHSMGFATFASIEPVIDWDSSERVIRDSIMFCDHYKIGLRSGVKKGYYDALGSYWRVRLLVQYIANSGSTVYLKRSVTKLLGSDKENISGSMLLKFMPYTVDMDGNPWTEVLGGDKIGE